MDDIISNERWISGYRSVDNEHRLQLNLIGAIRQAVAEGRPKSEIDEIIDRLIDFTREHFDSEDALMRLFQYPHADNHADEHERTLQQLEELGAAHRSGRVTLTLDRVDMLSDWIRQHILTTDDALGRYLVRLGVGPG